MKEQIIKIAKDIELGTINEAEAQNLLLGLFSVSNLVNCQHEKGRRSSVTSDYWKCSKCGETFKGN